MAGPAGLIEALRASADLEALAADPADPVVTGPGDLPGWLASLVEDTVTELLANHRARLATSRFTATFELQRRRWRNRTLHYACDDRTQASGSTGLNEKDLHRQLHDEIVMMVMNQVEG